MGISRFLLLVLLISLFASFGYAEIRSTEVRSDERPIIPIDEFGFTHTGRLELNVSDARFSNQSPDIDLDNVGFFLCTRKGWMHVLQQLEDEDITCPLRSDSVKLITTFKSMNDGSIDYLYNEIDTDQYTLVFANCPQVKVSMNIRSAMYNLDGKKKTRNYLSDGETILPSFYFLLSLVYVAISGIWISMLYKKRLTVTKIHFLMLAVVISKAFNLVCKAEDISDIKRTGSAHGRDALFYAFNFLEGTTFFTLIILIGNWWSFLNPSLQCKEKTVLMIVIQFQVVASIARFVIDETGPYGEDWITCKQVLLLADIICCFAVLFPMYWSIKNLREAARTDGKTAVKKLTLFSRYYIMVVCYIFLTRFLVYALETITSYKYAWSSVLAWELATLAFYVFTGYRFKPEAHNYPYVIEDEEEEEEAAAEVEKQKMIEESDAGDQP